MATSSAVSLALGVSGLEDVPLTFEPEVSFWKVDKPRHTHFIIDYQTVEHASPAYNKELTFELPKNCDLIRRISMVIELPALLTSGSAAAGSRYTDDVGRAMFEYIKLMTGTSVINTLYPELMHALEELQVDPANQWGQLTGRCDTVAELVDRAKSKQVLIVPLDFYMNGTDGDALPYINMIASGLTIKAKVRPFADCVVTSVQGVASDAAEAQSLITKMYLLLETVLLNDTERQLFAKADKMIYSYINYDVNTTTLALNASPSTVTMELDFNHPVKDLIVLFRRSAKGAGQTAQNTDADRAYFDFKGDVLVANAPFQGEAFLTMKLRLNGNDYWTAQDPHFYRKYLALTRYGRIPRKHIYPVPIALYPGSDKATGHANFSKFDKRHLVFTLPALIAAFDVMVFNRHWNVLKFEKHIVQVMYA